MSHIQDTLALLRGVQIVARAAVSTNEAYARHLWANSSIRTLLEQGASSALASGKSVAQNPQQELQRAVASIRETLERGGVAIEGARQYAQSAAGVNLGNSPTTESETKVKPTLDGEAKFVPPSTKVGGYDVSAITLKELQSILADKTTKESTEPISESTDVAKDEKYIETWMKYIAQSEGKTEHKPPETVKPVEDKDNLRRKQADKPLSVPELSSQAQQRSVPSSRIGRLASFGSLFAGLGLGTANELVKGAVGLGGSSNIKDAVFSPANTDRIVNTLCRVRGAALKIGQILSIQDSSVVSPAVVKAFERVRQAADYMPDWQLERCMVKEFGTDWRTKELRAFDDKPFAAASIGQVHRAEMKSDGMVVAVKIQYPGVAKSISSDIDNLVGMLKVWDVFPAGFFIDNIVLVAKRELNWEVDYLREADYTEKYGEMVSPYPEYRVPKIIRSLTTKSVITTEFVPGVPLDKCFDLSYEDRYFVAESMMKLCLRELFEMRCMQTDPNWSNFLFDENRRQLVLIDFGATRFYTDTFIDNYRNVIRAAIRKDGEEVLNLSRKMGFLTGYETKQMEDAHVTAVMTLGEPFRFQGEFDFGHQNTTKRIAALVPTMVAHRLCPPPEEIYSIHRKLSGVFLLCSRLNVKMDCRRFFEEIVDHKRS